MGTHEHDSAVVKIDRPEHTPGPWHVSRGELSGVVEIGVDDARDNFICTMHGIPPANNAANARLIAAAPDMLAALKHVGQALSNFLYRNPNNEELMAAFRLVVPAVHKAVGDRESDAGGRASA